MPGWFPFVFWEHSELLPEWVSGTDERTAQRQLPAAGVGAGMGALSQHPRAKGGSANTVSLCPGRRFHLLPKPERREHFGGHGRLTEP